MSAHQAPPSLGFSRQEHWSGLPFPSPGDLPDPGIEPRSPELQEDSLPSEKPGKLIIREMQIKTTIRNHFTLEWPPSKGLQTINAGEGVEKRESFYTVGGNAN